jgi:hypothetical protein
LFIKYNGTNVHAFGHIDQDKTKPTIGGPQNIVWLRPGWNEFPSHIWEMYTKPTVHPEVQKMLDDKKIELMDEKVGTGKKKKTLGQDDEPFNLKDLTDSKAIEVVKSTFNREILQRWSDEENRSKVKRALEEQIKPLLPDKKAS